MKKVFSPNEKNRIRNEWCDKLCGIFNHYYRTNEKLQLSIPTYIAQVLSTLDVLDFSKIDFAEKRINIFDDSARTNNEELVYRGFDRLISEKIFIGDLLVEYRGYYNTESMPF